MTRYVIDAPTLLHLVARAEPHSLPSARLTALKMRLLGDRVSRRTAWKIARDEGWDTTYDAEYLAVTKLQADALITVNRELAAMAEGIVPLASVAVLTGDDD